jgi:hypothetical protein
MEKKSIIDEIRKSLDAIGIKPVMGQGTDLTIDEEFLDVKWSTGKKKIMYHNASFLDEKERVLYYWETTKEEGSGFSFGTSKQSSFQSGMTLMRKVKHMQYGPEGKVYEVELDLGAITKAYKEAAKSKGWKFKVVLNRDKATYPNGYSPFSTEEVSEDSEEPHHSQGFCNHCGEPLVENAEFCQNCGCPVGGKIFPAQPKGKKGTHPKKKMGKKGCLIVFLCIFVVIILLLIIGLLSSGEDKNAADSQNQMQTGGSEEIEPLYVNLGYSYSVYPAATDETTSEFSTYYLGLYNHLIHSFYFDEDPENPQGSKVKEIRIKDFSIKNSPELGEWDGRLAGMFTNPMEGNFSDMEYENGILIADVSSISEANNGWSGSVAFDFHMVNIGSATFGPDYSGVINAEVVYDAANITSEQVGFTFFYVVEIITFGGDEFYREVEISTLQGDFLHDEAYQYVDESVWETSQGTPFCKKGR